MTDTLEIFGTEYSGVTGIKATDDNDNIKTYIRPQGTKSISGVWAAHSSMPTPPGAVSIPARVPTSL